MQLKQFSSFVASSSAFETPRGSANQAEQLAFTSVSDERSFVEPVDFAMDFSDTLFSTFNQLFPDPKEMCK